jgi:hypothetical protein
MRVEFKPHLLHRFLTFYADLIKWADGLMGWPDTVITFYADLIKWADGLMGWSDTVSRSA